ncbi:MAG: shikimate dehydrogenase [SAR202 cluster bacterium]|nr:shikimate dehydrogenase [SAR202 cluster bacterium]
MNLRAGIFGYPLGHSISPAFQQAAFDHLGIDAIYEAWETPPEKLGHAVASLRSGDFMGANVTVPHKQAVQQHLDTIEPLAASIGAVNTIVRDDSQLVGHNTDAYGFSQSLKREAKFEPTRKRVVLIGSGGAARAAAYGLAQEGIASLVIANRTLGSAVMLAEEMSNQMTDVRASSLESESLESHCAAADLIVNTTSIGMLHGPAEGRSPILEEFIPGGCLVYDIVYNPEVTPLLKAARRAGAQTLGGLPMLVYQGAAAFELWTGQPAPIEIMFTAAQKALES